MLSRLRRKPSGRMATGQAGDTPLSPTDVVAQRRPSATQINPGEISRPINLQRIAQRKAQVRTYPKTKKLEKLGVYSSCKVSLSCNCKHFCVHVFKGRVNPATISKSEFCIFFTILNMNLYPFITNIYNSP